MRNAKTLQTLLLILALLLLISALAWAYFAFRKRPGDKEKIPQSSAAAQSGPCVTVPVKGVDIKVCISDIVNAAKSIWNIYANGIPVYNVQEDFAEALPCVSDPKVQGGRGPLGLHEASYFKKCRTPSWDMMENFSSVTAGPYSATIRSGWPHYKQVSFTYQPIWTCKGSIIVNGQKKGQYISRATVLVKELEAVWLNKVDVVCSVAEIFNKGTVDNPIAAVHFYLDVQVKNPVFSKKFWKCNIFLYGDGTHEIQACSPQTPEQAARIFRGARS